MKYVIKVAEARAILAHGDNNLGVPLVRTNREGSMIYYTADPDEMALWRASQNTSGVLPDV